VKLAGCALAALEVGLARAGVDHDELCPVLTAIGE